MSTTVVKDAYVVLNSVDLSQYVRSVELTLMSETADDTAMGDDSRNKVITLKDGRFSITFNLELGAGAVEATLWAIFNGGAAVAFIIGLNGSTESASNPHYVGNCILSNYQVIGSNVGDKGEVTEQFEVTGDVTRDVTP